MEATNTISRADIGSAIWVTPEELAVFLDLSVKEVEELYNDGWFMKSMDKKFYHMDSVIKQYFQGRQSRPDESKAARARQAQEHQEELQQRKRQELAEKRKHLVGLKDELNQNIREYGEFQ